MAASQQQTAQQQAQSRGGEQQIPKAADTKGFKFIEQEDLDKLAKAKRKIFTMPITMMAIFTGLVGFFKYARLGEYLANPLARPSHQTIMPSLVKKKGKYVFLHSLALVCVGSALGSLLAHEIHTYIVYTKYSREVSYYMRWKIEREVMKTVV